MHGFLIIVGIKDLRTFSQEVRKFTTFSREVKKLGKFWKIIQIPGIRSAHVRSFIKKVCLLCIQKIYYFMSNQRFEEIFLRRKEIEEVKEMYQNTHNMQCLSENLH